MSHNIYYVYKCMIFAILRRLKARVCACMVRGARLRACACASAWVQTRSPSPVGGSQFNSDEFLTPRVSKTLHHISSLFVHIANLIRNNHNRSKVIMNRSISLTPCLMGLSGCFSPWGCLYTSRR